LSVALWHAICPTSWHDQHQTHFRPMDFSKPADEALNYAFDLAQAMGATVSLAHVFDYPFEPNFSSEQYVPMPTDFRDGILAVRRQLADRVGRSGRSDVSSEVLALGSVAERVVRTATCPVLTVRSTAIGRETKAA
jgi:nucleotide-binding universal stress UspA family protein